MNSVAILCTALVLGQLGSKMTPEQKKAASARVKAMRPLIPTETFTTSDWSDLAITEQQIRGESRPGAEVCARMFSFHDGGQWHTGTAWIIQEFMMVHARKDRPADITMVAQKGNYQILKNSKDSDTMIMRLVVTKAYHAESLPVTFDNRWTVLKDHEPHGADLLIELDEKGKIPLDNVRLVVDRGFHADAQGKEITKYATADNITERLSGRGKKLSFDDEELTFADVGEVITLRRGDVFTDYRFTETKGTPPTFKVRQDGDRIKYSKLLDLFEESVK